MGLGHSMLALPFTLMIDPAGDAKHTGRMLQDTFERGVTLQCAQLLKKELNQRLPQLRVVISRVPGESIQPLQNASFANRLQVDLYLSISFYQQTQTPPQISLFYYLAHPTDHWHTYQPLSFYHICQAHMINMHTTVALGKKLLHIFQNSSINSYFNSQGMFGIPYKPLLGIKAPAIAIEAGLAQGSDYVYVIDPLIAFIQGVASCGG